MAEHKTSAKSFREADRSSNAARCSSGSGVQRNDVASRAVQTVGEKPREAPEVEMGVEDSGEVQVKRAKTIMGLEICVLDAQDDVYDEAPGAPTNVAETFDENTTDDEDAVAPEMTEEQNRLETLCRPCRAPTVDELMPR